MEKFYCKSIDETNLVATKFAQSLNKGDVVFLYGDLGAGKTTFTKALLKALNISDNVTSPTFTLLNNYCNNDINICHFDLYRIEDIEELKQLGFEEFFYSYDVICLIEWPQIIEKSIDRNYKVVQIKKIDENAREILIGESNEDFSN